MIAIQITHMILEIVCGDWQEKNRNNECYNLQTHLCGYHNVIIYHYSDVIWVSWYIKSLVNLLCVHLFVQVFIK